MTYADLPWWIVLPAALLLVTGSLLTLIGALGLLRLPHLYARLHGPAMGATLGLYCILIAGMLVASFVEQRVVLHQLLIALFIILTAPVTAILLMQAALYRERRRSEK